MVISWDVSSLSHPESDPVTTSTYSNAYFHIHLQDRLLLQVAFGAHHEHFGLGVPGRRLTHTRAGWIAPFRKVHFTKAAFVST